ncbi:MAG: glycosyltransferase family 4 protein [Candidatus Omnitrophica bacterium]|nr:glycosyltransferase family 4 protein [Candidatus Omnitrophota bacterium]
MKIAIDCRMAASKRKGGISLYTYSLVHNLAKIDDENSYLLYLFKSRNFIKDYREIKSRFSRHKNFRITGKLFSSEIVRLLTEKLIPLELLTGGADVIHIPHPASPITLKAKLVTTIHDLIHVVPETDKWHYPRKSIKTRKKLRESILKSDMLIADSESTKNDIMKYFAVDPSKISVIYLGLDADIFHIPENAGEKENILEKYKISKKYIFFVGTLHPRKNIVRVLSSFEKIKKRFGDYQLVIAGKKGWLYEDFFEKLGKLPPDIRDDIILAGYTPLDDIPYLYNGAALSLYPSLYEGFGLPILEAMACGCPVITSNLSSMPEVAGGAAILVDPYNVEELSSAIEKVLSDGQLRQELQDKGLERVKSFSWQKTAKETLQVYKEVCGSL